MNPTLMKILLLALSYPIGQAVLQKSIILIDFIGDYIMAFILAFIISILIQTIRKISGNKNAFSNQRENLYYRMLVIFVFGTLLIRSSLVNPKMEF